MTTNSACIFETSHEAPTFFHLPRELRDVIYAAILTPPSQSLPTFGKGSKITISILLTCHSIHREASETLYNTLQIAKMKSGTDRILFGKISSLTPPIPALLKLHHIHLELTFSSVNRGECEAGIVNATRWKDMLLPFGLALLRGRAVRSLEISLLNTNQRKVGAKRLRSDQMRSEVRQLLEVFAYLPGSVSVTVSGFDTLEYVIMLEGMREEYAGKEIPIDNWATRALIL